MEITGYYPQRHVELHASATDMETAAQEWQEAHPDAVIDSIDGTDVVGTCEACSVPVLVTDEDRAIDSEGVIICGKCNGESAADMRSIETLKAKADSFDAIWEVCVELGMKVLPPGLDEDGDFIPEEHAYQFAFIRNLAAAAKMADDAQKIVREFARTNPRSDFRGETQDPCGANAWLESYSKLQ